MRPAWPGWALPAGLAALAASFSAYVLLVRLHPALLWDGLDLRVYYGAGTAYRAGQPVYDLTFTSLRLPFVYPPVTLLAFGAISLLPVFTVKVLTTLATVAALTATAWVALGMLGYSRSNARSGAACAIAAVLIWSEPVQQNLIYGQVNAVLMLFVLADLALPDRRRLKGVGIGVAAAVKLVPLIFVAYLLCTRRLRAAAVAVATFTVLGVLGFVVAPGASGRYWFGGLFMSSRRVANTVGPGYVANQSLYGLTTRLTGGTRAGEVLWLILAVMVAVAGLALATVAYRRFGELAGALVCALVALLVSPISWTHHWVWIVPAAAALAHAIRTRTGAVRRVLIGGSALLAVVWLAWPGPADSNTTLPIGWLWMLPNNSHAEYGWNLRQRLVGESYTIVGVLLLAAGWLMVRHSRPAPPDPLRWRDGIRPE